MVTIFIYDLQSSIFSLTADTIDTAEHDLAKHFCNTLGIIEWVFLFTYAINEWVFFFYMCHF